MMFNTSVSRIAVANSLVKGAMIRNAVVKKRPM
jgi:hypothetical protein